MSIIDHVKASLYRNTTAGTVDLLVHPDEAESIQDILEAKGMTPRFTVIMSDAIALGHMVVVDKLGVLAGLELKE